MRVKHVVTIAGLLLVASAVTVGLLQLRAPRKDTKVIPVPVQESGALIVAESEAENEPEDTPNPAATRQHALVIGINDYADRTGHGWQDLVTASNDAATVAQVLHDTYGFESITELYNEDATRENVIVALDRLSEMTAEDSILIYYAGHGYFDEKLGEGYWVPSGARMNVDGRSAKQDWVWNSMITKMIGACAARHVLVIADSCYGGSLFRGGDSSPPQKDQYWYLRAAMKPSRFLISSGDIEPVMDGMGQHSIFARELLNVLSYGDDAIFSASELSLLIRTKVSSLTGQLVRAGPLPVPTHAGGEFVFRRTDAAPPTEQELVSLGQTRDITSPSPVAATIPQLQVPNQQLLQDALVLAQRGATNSADQLVQKIQESSGDDRLAKAVAAHLAKQTRAERRSNLSDRIDRIGALQAASDPKTIDPRYARPRTVVSLGPSLKDNPDDELGLLYRISIEDALLTDGRVILVDRDSLDDIMQELEISASSLSGREAVVTVGKLLPASLLLMGEIIPSKSGQHVILKLIDTETSQTLGMFRVKPQDKKNIEEAGLDLAIDALEAIVARKPLTAAVLGEDGDRLKAGIGWFHGAKQGARFEILDPSSTVLGEAEVIDLGERESLLSPSWAEGTAKPAVDELRVREM